MEDGDDDRSAFTNHVIDGVEAETLERRAPNIAEAEAVMESVRSQRKRHNIGLLDQSAWQSGAWILLLIPEAGCDQVVANDVEPSQREAHQVL